MEMALCSLERTRHYVSILAQFPCLDAHSHNFDQATKSRYQKGRGQETQKRQAISMKPSTNEANAWSLKAYLSIILLGTVASTGCLESPLHSDSNVSSQSQPTLRTNKPHLRTVYSNDKEAARNPGDTNVVGDAAGGGYVTDRYEDTGYRLYTYILFNTPMPVDSKTKCVSIIEAFVSGFIPVQLLEKSAFDKSEINVVNLFHTDKPVQQRDV